MTQTPVTQTFSVREAVELAVVERSGFVESRHAGSAVVLGPDGSLLRALGAPDAPILPRSSLKPFQAVAMIAAGAGLEGADAVIATASHAGTPAHIALVRGLLARADLPVSALQCVADWPLDTVARDELVRDGATKQPLYMNCSGKHAAMLLTCVRNGWPTSDYLDPSHPLQMQIKDVVQRLTGENVHATAVDGCGAPIHAVTLTGLARGIQRIATASESSPFALYRGAAALRAAVLANGWAIDGPGRANTVVIDRLGTFAKGGAEGVMVMAAPDGTTVVLKMLDGSARAATVVALTLLVQAGALRATEVAAALPELHIEVLGGGRPVGTIRPTV
jgi:L-asparaginase II